MRIGVVDLDTSHPQNWIPILRQMGHTVAGVWDGGSVHPPGYAARFAAALAIPRVFQSLEEMAADVDCAIIHSCDWDTHVAKARPFVDAGRAVFIDKPLAGNVRDLMRLRGWVRRGARLTGGSSLRFCAETRQWLGQPEAERDVPHTAMCGCGVDEFNYGIHAYSMLAGIMGPGAVSVQHLGAAGGQRRIRVSWPDGRMGIAVVGRSEGWIPFYATVVTPKCCHQYQADANMLYRALLEATIPYLAGETEEPPVSPDALVEPELWAIAAQRSWLEGDRQVELAELAPSDPGYDGGSFAEEYRRAKYP